MDYWQRIQTLNEDQLLDEIKKVQDKLFKLNNQTMMRLQLNDMLSMAQTRYNDMLQFKMNEMREESEPEVIELGEIESVAYTPNYSKEELLTDLVKFYHDKEGPIEKEELKQEQPIEPKEPSVAEEMLKDVPVFTQTKTEKK
jgi:hypothetical protein